MTEAEWFASTDAVQLLAHLNRPQGDRLLLLFGLACCRAILPLLTQPEIREGVEVAERFAEGQTEPGELAAADWHLEGAVFGIERYRHRPKAALPEPFAQWVASVEAIPKRQIAKMACCGGEELLTDPIELMVEAGYFANHILSMHDCYPHDPSLKWHRRFLRVAILRDIFGNPFHCPIIDPQCLTWNGGTVVKLAHTIYDERRFGDLPVLADAVEEAGCDNLEILQHCRQPGPHARGCWVLDLFLGKDRNVSETLWVGGQNPKEMLGLLTGGLGVSDRKYRLFACACCRRIWHALSDERSRVAVEVAERSADGLATDEEREQAQAAAADVRLLGGIAAKWTTVATARTAATMTLDAAGQTAACPPGQEFIPEKWQEEWKYQADLLRHIIGNPFRPYRLYRPHDGLDFWPSSIVQLADALYRGEDCIVALHDTLRDAGYFDLADHFEEAWHPKGCWVLDLILGRK